MRFVLAAILMIACAARQPPPAPPPPTELELDQDDDAALPACAPRCFSGSWREAPVRIVMYEVAHCSDTPVFFTADVRARVTVTYSNLDCAATIAVIAEAAGLDLRTIAVTRVVDEREYSHVALVISPPGSRSRTLLGAWISPYRDGVIRGTEGSPADDEDAESDLARWSRWADPNANYVWITPGD